jgi:mRNA interferase YafQ
VSGPEQLKRRLERTRQFKRDYKRVSRGRYGRTLDARLAPILLALANDQALEVRHRDHALSGAWSDFRDCHVRPDLVMIYQKPDEATLRLVRLGSHSELGL